MYKVSFFTHLSIKKNLNFLIQVVNVYKYLNLKVSWNTKKNSVRRQLNKSEIKIDKQPCKDWSDIICKWILSYSQCIHYTFVKTKTLIFLLLWH